MIKLKRRAFLAGTSAVFILPALPVFATEFKEADIMKTKVSSGALPALKDRLPENPLVVKPVESVGKYG
ncbi:ABC transporter substrate-binding protein, partial [Rhizobium ruizarguesonis]